MTIAGFQLYLCYFLKSDLGKPLKYVNENHTKETWKKIFKTADNKYWYEHPLNEARGKQSLKFLNLESSSNETQQITHHVWDMKNLHT